MTKAFLFITISQTVISMRRNSLDSSLERWTTTLAGRQESQLPMSAADSVLCHSCARLPLEDPLKYVLLSSSSRESVLDSMKHGIRFSVSVEAGCPLCRLAVETIRAQSCYAKDTKVEEFEYILSMITEILMVKSYSLDNRVLMGRIRILEDDRDRLRPLPRNYQSTGVGRKIKHGQIDFTLVRSWLQDCEKSPDHDCASNLSEPIDIILIDVHDNRLVRRRSNVRYIALSYVWGQAGGLQTLNENYETLQDKGALSPDRSDIPRTIADSMMLVLELQERYLWVDRLCILQDSEQKHATIRNMGKIYSHALLTIFALSGADANNGLPGVRPHSRPPQTIEKVRTARFLSALPSLGDSLEMSLHITRGWTFQEVLLSPRRLFVSDRQVYFHCKKNGVRCEDTTGTDTDTFEQIHGLRKKILLLDEGVDKNTYDWEGSRSVYDILDAFTGISSVLGYEYRMNGCEELIAGLPRREFLRYLPWSPKETPTRRLPRVTGRHEECFPSWSWIGWMCPISYKRIGSRVIEQGMWMNEVSTPCTIELIQPDGVQRVVHQPPGFCYYDYPSWMKFHRMPPQDTLPDIVPYAIVSKHPGHSILHFRTLAVPATKFYNKRWSDTPFLWNAQRHLCGILVGKTPPSLDLLLPKCKYVFLCYAHVLARDLSKYIPLDDWIYNEFDEARCVPFFLLLYRGGELWERVGLAIITWKAFESAQPEWENILLA
ncbi:hypothetical protein AnigIFM50267_008998 [Aspergillus niger]|nr:hypothetical protein AnigIFM50267_008998 [Aspergillus niger]